MVMPAAAVTLSGEPRYFKTVGDAGYAVHRGFCASCGAPVTVKLERIPEAKTELQQLSKEKINHPAFHYARARLALAQAGWGRIALSVLALAPVGFLMGLLQPEVLNSSCQRRIRNEGI